MTFKLLRHGLMISLLLFCTSLQAQISYGGTPLFKTGSLKSNLSTVYLPEFDFSISTRAQENANLGNYLKHAQYAYKYEVAYSTENSGVWDSLVDGRRVWRISISSEGAYSLGLNFSRFRIPTGGQVFVYNNQTDRVLGAYTDKSNKKSNRFAVEPLEGDEIVVEYVEPLQPEFTVELEIGAVLHDYKNIFNRLEGDESNLKSSGSCNVNINCSEGDDWQTEKKAVCHILYGGYLASGALINNTSLDGSPYFLTAHHVIDSEEEAEIAIFYFNYEAEDCDSTEGSKSQSISGASLLATADNLDFTLLELSVMPPSSYSPYYLGWDRSGRVPSNTVCIHHPSGDVKKISGDYDEPLTDTYYDSEYSFDTDTHWRIVEWDYGTTEGGSSGSPLFDENHRVIGDLTGGEASCSNSVNDYYAKFSESWANYSNSNEQLKYWLDPLDTGVETLDGIDPYNGLSAAIRVSEDTICSSSEVTLTDASFGDPDEFYWDFGEGADPEFSTDEGPHTVSYSNAGLKSVKLVVSKDGVADSVYSSILVMDAPIADFDYSLQTDSISFTNTSTNGLSYDWDFGDGEYSSLENPAHVYASRGSYWVELMVTNVCQSDSKTMQIINSYEDMLSIYPNPSNAVFTVDLSRIVFSEINWYVYDTKGSRIRSGLVSNYDNTINFNLKGLATGVYLLRLNIDGEQLQRKLLLVD
ncbi:PKD domain-containing protein [Labilibaculum sp.]|uniref:T9SS type A sorting domain-containing protein n=1 Tax=Labilibaculum sp. TaxID=2060723 RepID=UPI003566FCC1